MSFLDIVPQNSVNINFDYIACDCLDYCIRKVDFTLLKHGNQGFISMINGEPLLKLINKFQVITP